MKKPILLTTLFLALAACGQNPNRPAAHNNSPDAETADDSETATPDNARHLTDAEKMKYDVDGAQLGASYAAIRSIWVRSHPRYHVETKTDWIEGLGSYVREMRVESASNDDAFEAYFSSPASGNRAFFLSHTLQDVGTGKSIDRKASEALVASKFGDASFANAPNTYGGEIVGRDGKLIEGCEQFQFPDKLDVENPGQNHAQCGLTALATITGDNESTADSVTLQETDFGLLAKLEKDEATGLDKVRENVGRTNLKHAVKPAAL